MSRQRLLFELCKHRALPFHTAAAAIPMQPRPALQHEAANVFSVMSSLHTERYSSPHKLSAQKCVWYRASVPRTWQHAEPDVSKRSHTHRAAALLASASCWFCSETLQSHVDLLICPNCGALQQVREDVNYFQMFGLGEDYNVDLGKLQKTLQRLQLMVHPDKHSTKGDDVRKLAEQQSSQLNKAFTALRSPLERAKYLLEMKGFPVQEDARLDDSKFLVEVMELREEVAEAEGEANIHSLLAANAERQQTWEGKILQAFTAGQLSEAQRLVFELAYWDRIDEQLKEKL